MIYLNIGVIHNAETMKFVEEALDNLNNHKLKSASSYTELEKSLNKG